ncbi:hypothetical protein C360_04079 [Cryptococcus neoformans Bt15]|nr:hypothetical protein C360_04079 [Cryptococcus neoformans var. grubii Bt15]
MPRNILQQVLQPKQCGNSRLVDVFILHQCLEEGVFTIELRKEVATLGGTV